MNALTLFDRFLEDMYPTINDEKRAWGAPKIDLYEEPEKFVMKADLPGMTQDDVKVEWHDGVLKVHGERKFEHEEKDDRQRYFKRERVYGAFDRAFNLGNVVDEDKIQATMKDGVLTVQLGKREGQKKKLVQIS